MLRLLEVLNIRDLPQGSFKIHLATSITRSPLDLFFEGKFKEWQEEQNSKNFECDQVLSLINLSSDLWLFAGVYKILGVTKGHTHPYLYQTELLPNQDDLIGRIIVRYKRKFRNANIWGHKYAQELEIAEIRAQPLRIREFPGYNNVIVSFRELCLLVQLQDQGWKSALTNVRGIYLISDRSNGKH